MKELSFDKIKARLDAIPEGFANRVAKVGWFPSAKYEDGTPVAYVAAIQEYGGTFNHPGGTPYKISADGMVEFVNKNSPGADALPVTKAHSITIPPRPFMRQTVEYKKGEWTKQLVGGMKKVVRGQMKADDVLEAVGTLAAADIAKTIAAGNFTPLSAATLAQREAKGQGSAILQATGLMIATITSQVGDTE